MYDLLFQKLQVLVDKKVRVFKSDFEIDKFLIRLYPEETKWWIIIRESGTDLGFKGDAWLSEVFEYYRDSVTSEYYEIDTKEGTITKLETELEINKFLAESKSIGYKKFIIPVIEKDISPDRVREVYAKTRDKAIEYILRKEPYLSIKEVV